MEGRVQVREYTDRSGGKRFSLDVNAGDVQFLGQRRAEGAGREAEPREDGPDQGGTDQNGPDLTPEDGQGEDNMPADIPFC